jgi:hypothetical protein
MQFFFVINLKYCTIPTVIIYVVCEKKKPEDINTGSFAKDAGSVWEIKEFD